MLDIIREIIAMMREETRELSDAESLLRNVSAITGERLRNNRSEHSTETGVTETHTPPTSRTLANLQTGAGFREFTGENIDATQQVTHDAKGSEQLFQELRRLREDNSVIIDGIKSLSERDGGDEPIIEAVTLE